MWLFYCFILVYCDYFASKHKLNHYIFYLNICMGCFKYVSEILLQIKYFSFCMPYQIIWSFQWFPLNILNPYFWQLHNFRASTFFQYTLRWACRNILIHYYLMYYFFTLFTMLNNFNILYYFIHLHNYFFTILFNILYYDLLTSHGRSRTFFHIHFFPGLYMFINAVSWGFSWHTVTFTCFIW